MDYQANKLFLADNNFTLFDKSFPSKVIISALILLCPFTLGEFPILSYNYIHVSWGATIILIVLNLYKLIDHKRILKSNFSIPILLFALAFFASNYYADNYKQMKAYTVFDSSANGVFLDIIMFVPLQILLIFVIYVSIENMEELYFYIKVFLLSGLLTNLIGMSFLFSGHLEHGRLAATFSDANYYGRFQVFILTITLCFVFFKKLSFLEIIFLIANSLLCFLALFLTGSRSSFIVMAIIFAIITLFTRYKKLKYLLIIGFLAIVAFFLMYATSRRLDSNGLANMGFAGAFVDYSNSTRLALAVAAVNIFRDYPFMGVGFRNFYNYYMNYNYMPLGIPLAPYVSVVHSWLFSIMAEMGLVGLIPIFWIIILVIKNFYRRIKIGLNDKTKLVGLILYCMFLIIIIFGLFFPVFESELVFALVCGLSGAFFKITEYVKN